MGKGGGRVDRRHDSPRGFVRLLAYVNRTRFEFHAALFCALAARIILARTIAKAAREPAPYKKGISARIWSGPITLLIQCCKEPIPYDIAIDVAAASRKGYKTEERAEAVLSTQQETHFPLGQVIAQLGSADTETLDR